VSKNQAMVEVVCVDCGKTALMPNAARPIVDRITAMGWTLTVGTVALMVGSIACKCPTCSEKEKQ